MFSNQLYLHVRNVEVLLTNRFGSKKKRDFNASLYSRKKEIEIIKLLLNKILHLQFKK